MLNPTMTTQPEQLPEVLTVVCIGLLHGKEYSYSKTFSGADRSERAQRWATLEMRWEGTKRVSCKELGFDVPGDFF